MDLHSQILKWKQVIFPCTTQEELKNKTLNPELCWFMVQGNINFCGLYLCGLLSEKQYQSVVAQAQLEKRQYNIADLQNIPNQLTDPIFHSKEMQEYMRVHQQIQTAMTITCAAQIKEFCDKIDFQDGKPDKCIKSNSEFQQRADVLDFLLTIRHNTTYRNSELDRHLVLLSDRLWQKALTDLQAVPETEASVGIKERTKQAAYMWSQFRPQTEFSSKNSFDHLMWTAIQYTRDMVAFETVEHGSEWQKWYLGWFDRATKAYADSLQQKMETCTIAQDWEDIPNNTADNGQELKIEKVGTQTNAQPPIDGQGNSRS